MNVAQIAARSVLVRWEPGFDGNSSILGYNVYQRNLDNDTTGDYVPVATPSGVGVYTTTSTMYNVSMGISPFTQYAFVVEVCNVVGCSNRTASPSSPIRTRPDGKV